jgi:hypothetical protein
VQILKNNIKTRFIRALAHSSHTGRFLHLGLVRQMNPYKTRSLICYLPATEKNEQIYFTKLVEAPEYLLNINSDTFVTNWVRSNLELCFIDLFVTSLFVTLAEKNHENGGCGEIYMF